MSSLLPRPHAAAIRPPRNLQFIRVNPNAFVCEWAGVDCCSQNGLIQGYQVRLYRCGDLLFEKFLANSDGKHLAVKNLKLCPNTYSFTVAAVNDAGLGVFAEPVSPHVKHSGKC